MTMYTINDPTQEIFDDAGNKGICQDGDPVWEAYLAWVAQSPDHIPNHNFVYPDAPKPPITKLEFMNRFTDAELAAIYTAAKQAVMVEIWLEKFKLAEFVDSADPRTIAGINALEAAGLIDPGRAAAILAG